MLPERIYAIFLKQETEERETGSREIPKRGKQIRH